MKSEKNSRAGNRKMMLRVIPFVIVLLLGTILAITQKGWFTAGKQQEPVKVDQDTVEEGELTNDDPFVEMNNIAMVYTEKKYISLSGDIRLYDEENEDKLIEKENFAYTVNGGRNYSCEIGKTSIISDDNLNLFVDHENKLISLSPQQIQGQAAYLFNIDTLKSIAKKEGATMAVRKLNDEKILVVNGGTGEVQGYRLYYSPGTFKINRVVMLIATVNNYGAEQEENDGETASGKENETTGDKSETATTDTSLIDGNDLGINLYTYRMEITYRSTVMTDPKPDYHPSRQFISVINKRVELAQSFRDYEINGMKAGEDAITTEDKIK